MTQEEASSSAIFTTWEHDGKPYHSIGLVQMWQRGYVPEGESWSDPPRKSERFQAWLDANNCEWLDFGAFGPPAVKFPDTETAARFKHDWHDPGEKHFADYLAGPEAEGLSHRNSVMLDQTVDDVWKKELSRRIQLVHAMIEEARVAGDTDKVRSIKQAMNADFDLGFLSKT